MNERQEKTSDILGKLTVMGTIVLPMNVVTGIWGMNWYVKIRVSVITYANNLNTVSFLVKILTA